MPGVQYFLEHHYGVFYILTNAPPENIGSVTGGYYLARCSADKSMLANWQVIILPDQDMDFVDMDIFHGHLVLAVQKKGLSSFCSINLPIDADVERPVEVADLDPWFFPLPSSLCNIVPGSNHDFTSSIYHVVVSSPVMPDILVGYDMMKQNFNILHQDEVAGITYDKEANKEDQNMHSDLSRAQYRVDKHLEDVEGLQKWSDLSETLSCERMEVSSHDGVKVPLTILYSKKAHCIGQSPGVLHGYGAYGEVLDKSWSSDLLSLLNRGWVFAYADVRGGGGDSSWHQTGSGLYKLNSMYDFAACGSFLINKGFVHKNRLGAIGSSAGGLLVASTVNMNPELFCAAILKVPFLDICNTMLNPSLPLTILDYEEFGDPKIKSLFETMRSYSPYDNIPSGVCYPSVLVTASLNDSRVGVWEAAKWVARVRENICPTCSASVILKTNMSGGHFGEGGRFSHCEDTAFEYAFLVKVIEAGLED